MSRWRKRRKNFRILLEGEGCVSPASVYDPMTARMAVDIGYECGILAGSTASMTVLGAPDHILLTLSELADQAARIGRASELPLLVDADHGYGNALNVMRTVEELEAAGVAGLSIEDTVLPMPYGAPGTPALISLEEGIGKIKAAMAARPAPDLVICARTSSARVEGIEACCNRVKAYDALGVDAIFLIGVPDLAALRQIASLTHKPIILGSAGAGLKDKVKVAKEGVRILLKGHQPLAAAMYAAYESLKALREEGQEPPRVSQGQKAAILKEADYQKQIEAYLEVERG